MRFNPQPGDEGSWLVIYAVVDDGTPSLSATGQFRLTVTAP